MTDDEAEKLTQEMQDRGTELFKEKLAQGMPFTEELIQEVADQSLAEFVDKLKHADNEPTRRNEIIGLCDRVGDPETNLECVFEVTKNYDYI